MPFEVTKDEQAKESEEDLTQPGVIKDMQNKSDEG